MTWVLKEKEIAALLAADGKRRYDYFIHRVCDTQKIWGLYDDGWASLGDGVTKLLPLWPHETFAGLFAMGEWSSHQPREIDLHEFLERWIPGLAAEGIEPAVFPNAQGRAVTVSLTDLEAHLRRELSEHYGEEG